MTNEKKKPATKFKVGRVNASVFANGSDKGTWYSVAIDRVYKKGEEFRRVSNFPEQELGNVELAAQLAKKWIADQRK